jgi:hypothetical protein
MFWFLFGVSCFLVVIHEAAPRRGGKVELLVREGDD